MSATHIIGDIHGQYDKLVTLLQAAKLVDNTLTWTGEDAALYFMGDFFDRGDHAIRAVDLVMRLQQEAHAAGGTVDALLGNHEVMILAAHRFGEKSAINWAESFMKIWTRNGGRMTDLDSLTESRQAWLRVRPAMIVHNDLLLIHADSLSYVHYGTTIEDVNRAIAEVLTSEDQLAWDQLLGDICERFAFTDKGDAGIKRAAVFLELFGGKQIIHGHTPIGYVTRLKPHKITEALVYADGLCVNVDGGMYQGGAGFVYKP